MSANSEKLTHQENHAGKRGLEPYRLIGQLANSPARGSQGELRGWFGRSRRVAGARGHGTDHRVLRCHAGSRDEGHEEPRPRTLARKGSWISSCRCLPTEAPTGSAWVYVAQRPRSRYPADAVDHRSRCGFWRSLESGSLHARRRRSGQLLDALDESLTVPPNQHEQFLLLVGQVGGVKKIQCAA